MAKIVNLNRARKSRDHDEKRREADANAAKHGRTKSERIFEAARSEKARAMLDQHLLDEE